MSKVTLEDVAAVLDSFGRSRAMHARPFAEKAALVRAADAVVEAGKELWAIQLRTPTTETGKDYFRMDAAEAMCRLGMALTAFNKISNGEQP